MKVFKHELRIDQADKMIAITDSVREDIEKSGIYDGVAVIMCPHTTAAITISENADPDVQRDILSTMERLIPRNDASYLHEDGNSYAHIKSAVLGASEAVIIENGRIILGLWQDIYFCEFDGPRTRYYYVKVMEG